MNTFFLTLLLGHIIGDYFLQSNEMVLNKKKSFYFIIFHCVVYSLAVSATTIMFVLSPYKFMLWFFIIFISHIFIDGTSIVNIWLNKIGSRSYENTKKIINQFGESSPESQYAIAYTAIVQTVVDNTIHLILIYAGFILLIKIL